MKEGTHKAEYSKELNKLEDLNKLIEVLSDRLKKIATGEYPGDFDETLKVVIEMATLRTTLYPDHK